MTASRSDAPVAGRDADRAAGEALAARIVSWHRAAPGASGADREAVAAAVGAAAAALVVSRGRGNVCLRGEALQSWLDALRRSPLVATGASPAAPSPSAGLRPLVLSTDPDGPRLYLQRDHALETELAQRLAKLALVGRLRLLSGGPGSGKTTRVAALLAERRRQRPQLQVVLLAPTGKAAARMNEALAAAGAQLDAPAQTLHRWLGRRPGLAHGGASASPSGSNAMSPRGGSAELVVVDEASMLDLDIAAALLRALPDGAELLLVGDAGQLAAVEAGAVFAEACAHPWPESAGPVHERLLGSHRYAADSPVARLAAALRQGDADAAAACGDTLRLGQPAQPADLEAAFGLGLSPYVERLRDPSATPADWLAARRLFMVLAAQHSGPRGVVALNRQIGHWMQRRLGMTPARDGTRPWPGRALLVQKNDPATGLANGDIGVVMPRPGGAGGARGGSGDAGAWQVWFDDAAGGARAIAYERLPEHADAFAMTVHKAQGSEADTVLVLLPPADQARREWLYTATTRARRRLWLAGELAALAQAALRPTPRDGGLGLRLQAALATGSDVSADPV